MRGSLRFTLGFATVVCIVCALAVSTTFVSLHDRIEQNRRLDFQLRVLSVAGLVDEEEELEDMEVRQRFARQVALQMVDVSGGAGGSVPVYMCQPDNGPGSIVLPVEGKGLWSTMRGLLALELPAAEVVLGFEIYEHGETPGLGGKVDEPEWKAQWKGRRAFDERGRPALHVARTTVGGPAEYPHGVDVLSGATITSKGVTDLLRHWLGPDGYGPFLAILRSRGEE